MSSQLSSRWGLAVCCQWDRGAVVLALAPKQTKCPKSKRVTRVVATKPLCRFAAGGTTHAGHGYRRVYCEDDGWGFPVPSFSFEQASSRARECQAGRRGGRGGGSFDFKIVLKTLNALFQSVTRKLRPCACNAENAIWGPKAVHPIAKHMVMRVRVRIPIYGISRVFRPPNRTFLNRRFSRQGELNLRAILRGIGVRARRRTSDGCRDGRRQLVRAY